MVNLTGQVIRDYELKSLIGVGGFGEVYQAYQRSIKRDVAVKIILPDHLQQREFVRRFQVEAETVAGLEHAYIVPLYDFWTDASGAYLVMRLYRGGSLQESIRADGPWDPLRALRMVEQVGSALHYAHKRSIVHQDIKAANVLLDEEQNCYLTDFGIAKNLLRPIDKDLIIYDEQGQEVVHGSPEYMAPEQIMRSGVDARTDVYSLGVVLYELLTGYKPFYSSDDTEIIQKQMHDQIPSVRLHRPDLPETFDIVIRKATEKTPGERYWTPMALAENFRQFVEAAGFKTSAPIVVSTTPSSVIDKADLDLEKLIFEPPNPFKGLRAFQERDAIDFFGRDALVEKLAQRIRQENAQGEARFLAVVGPSGSGKSSMVRAGLFPYLRRHSGDWYLMDMMPGAHPLQEFSSIFYSLMEDEDMDIDALIKRDTTGLHQAIVKVLGDFRSELVVLIDQFEEVYTHVQDAAERAFFLKSLVHAVTNPESRLRVIITLRADYMDKPLNDPILSTLLKGRVEFVTPMTENELYDAINEPARRVELSFEPGLVQQIIDDLVGEVGALPLLQFALTELYNSRDRRSNMMTSKAYHANGGVAGAMTRRADEIFSLMSRELQEVTQQVFMRLVIPGDADLPNTRRRVYMEELLSMESPDLVKQAIDRFQKRRLLTHSSDAQTSKPYVEVAHEELIRRWSVLRGWIDKNRDFIRLQQRLSAEAEAWFNNRRDGSFLAVGKKLAIYLPLMESPFFKPNERERQYLQASKRRDDRLNAVPTVIAFVAVAITFIVAVLALWARNSEQRAIESEQVARANYIRERAANLAGEARASLDSNVIDVAAMLAAEALDFADGQRVRSAALAVLQTDNQTVTPIGHLHHVIYDENASSLVAGISPDGTLIVTGNDKGQVRFWRAVDGQPDGAAIEVHTGAIRMITFSTDGERMATVGVDGRVALWQVGARTFRPFSGHKGTVDDAAFSPAGTVLVTVGRDGRVLLWDVESGVNQEIAAFDAEVLAVEFSPDTRLIALGVRNDIVLFDVVTGELRDPLPHEAIIHDVAFSADQTVLASAGGDSNVYLWNLDGDGRPSIDVARSEVPVKVVRFLQRHNAWLMGDDGGSLQVVQALDEDSPGQPVRIASIRNFQDAPVESIALDANETRFIATGGTNRVVVWDLTSPFSGGHSLPLESFEPVRSLHYADDGTLIGVQAQETGAQAVVSLWREGVRAHSVPLDIQSVHYAFAISPDGAQVAGVSPDSTVSFYDIATGELVEAPFKVPRGDLRAVTYSADGRYLAVGGEKGELYILEHSDNTWRLMHTLEGLSVKIWALAFSADGKLMASGGQDGRVHLWDVATGAPVGEPRASHTTSLSALAFSDNGRWLASGERSGAIILWRLDDESGGAYRLELHANWVTGLAFFENDTALASADHNGLVYLWDLSSAEPRRLGSQFNLRDDIGALALDKVRGKLAVGAGVLDTDLSAELNTPTRIAEWDLSPAAWQEILRALASDTITNTDIQRYLDQ